MPGLGGESALRVASDAGEDLVGGFGPNERLGGFVVGGDEFADGGLQFADTAVNPAADLLVGEFGKPPLDFFFLGGQSKLLVHFVFSVGGTDGAGWDQRRTLVSICA